VTQADLHDDLNRLRRKNALIKHKRDILKKRQSVDPIPDIFNALPGNGQAMPASPRGFDPREGSR
jgi:hypothetical protein